MLISTVSSRWKKILQTMSKGVQQVTIIQLIFGFLYLLFTSCSSQTHFDSDKIQSKLSDIKINDDRNKVITYLGKPTNIGSENYQGNKFEVLEYSDEKGIALGFITLDSRGTKVKGRSLWIARNKPENDFNFLLKNVLSGAKLSISFRTCDRHHIGEMKVDAEQGIFIGLDRGKVSYISWSSPDLTKLRIEEFNIKCSDRQK